MSGRRVSVDSAASASSASSDGPPGLDAIMDRSMRQIKAAVQTEREEMLGDLNATLAEVKGVQTSNRKDLEELRMWWPVVLEAQRYVVSNEEAAGRQATIEEEFYEYTEISTDHLRRLHSVIHQNLLDIKLEAKQMRAMARLGHERPNIFTPERPRSAAQGGSTAAMTTASSGLTSRPGSAARRMYDRSSTPQSQHPSRPSTAGGEESAAAAATSEHQNAAPSPFPSYSPAYPAGGEVDELELQGTRCINTTGRRSQILVPTAIESQGVTTMRFSHFVSEVGGGGGDQRTSPSSSSVVSPASSRPPSGARRQNTGDGAAPLPLSKNRHHVHLMLVRDPEEGEGTLQVEASVARVTIPNDCGNFAIDVCYKSKVMLLRSLPASPRRTRRGQKQSEGKEDDDNEDTEQRQPSGDDHNVGTAITDPGLESLNSIGGPHGTVISRDGVWSGLGQDAAANRLRFAFTLVQHGSLVDVEL